MFTLFETPAQVTGQLADCGLHGEKTRLGADDKTGNFFCQHGLFCVIARGRPQATIAKDPSGKPSKLLRRRRRSDGDAIFRV